VIRRREKGIGPCRRLLLFPGGNARRNMDFRSKGNPMNRGQKEYRNHAAFIYPVLLQWAAHPFAGLLFTGHMAPVSKKFSARTESGAAILRVWVARPAFLEVGQWA